MVRPDPLSLSARLLLISSAWAAFTVLAAGILLTQAYRETIEERFDETLHVYVKALISEIARQTPGFREIPSAVLGEPRFDFPLSGWYWVVRDYDTGEVVLSSRSLAGDHLPVDEVVETAVPGDVVRLTEEGPGNERVRIVARPVLYDAGAKLLFAVAADPEAVEADIAAFRSAVTLYLLFFSVVLILSIVVMVRVGLKPLERMRRQLQAIREGRTRHLEGSFPREVAPLAAEFNALIDSNQAVLDRARQHVGNLAHALKTPLSVILNEARSEKSRFASVVREQATSMHAQVRHHLNRARMAAKRRLIGVVTDVTPSLERLVRTIGRLSADRDLRIDVLDPGGLRFAGEAQDFEEMVGNLLDNAAKWARGRVFVAIGQELGGTGGDWLVVTVEDDGPGLSPAEREAALSRGLRLDETKPGTGLGLAIVKELADLYGGELVLAESALGGLSARLVLPIVPTR